MAGPAPSGRSGSGPGNMSIPYLLRNSGVILIIPEAFFGGRTRSVAGVANSTRAASRLAGVYPLRRRAVSLVTRKACRMCRRLPDRCQLRTLAKPSAFLGSALLSTADYTTGGERSFVPVSLSESCFAWRVSNRPGAGSESYAGFALCRPQPPEMKEFRLPVHGSPLYRRPRIAPRGHCR